MPRKNYPKQSNFEAYCDECTKEYRAEYRAKNVEKHRKYQHEYSKEKWARIKADPDLHLEAVELRRMYRYMKNAKKKKRTPTYSSKPEHLLVDKAPLVQFVEARLEHIGVRAFCEKCHMHDRTLYRMLNENQKVSFYVADQICIGFNRSVYDLYPEMLDDAFVQSVTDHAK